MASAVSLVAAVAYFLVAIVLGIIAAGLIDGTWATEGRSVGGRIAVCIFLLAVMIGLAPTAFK